jgi:hypothetical protein
MTLPHWLTSARETLDAAISAESNRQRQEVATDAQSELEARLGELLGLEVAVKVGREAGWFDCVWDSHGAGLAVDALVSKGPQRTEVNRLQTSLPAFVADARRHVTDAWIARVHSSVGRIEDLRALIEALGRIPGHQGQQKMLTTALQPVQKLMRSLPNSSSEKELKSVGEAVEAAFKKAFGDVEVREFLLAASRSGARLDQLTPTVRAWIEENKADDLVRVSIGSTS